MKKIILAALLVIAIAALAACGKKEPEPETVPETITEDTEEEPYMNVPNPWFDCGTLEDAAKLAGFSFVVPDRIEGYPSILIKAMKEKMIEVFYYDKDFAEDDHKDVLLRKGVGEEDISGDYNNYPEIKTVTMHGVDVTTRGSDGLVSGAIWTQGGYSYSISADDPMTVEQIDNLVEIMK